VLDRAAQMWRHHPLSAADVEWQPVGIEHQPGDRGVAGDPAGPGRRQRRAEARLAGVRIRAGQVGGRKGEHQVRL
jgi:hypothetical protein